MDLKKDVIPISVLKARMKQIVSRVMKTGDAVLVTQNGTSAVMIVDVGAYQKQQKKLYLLEEIAKGEREILAGKGVLHQDVKKMIKEW